MCYLLFWNRWLLFFVGFGGKKNYQRNWLILSQLYVLKQQSGTILFRYFDKTAHVTHCLRKVQLPAQLVCDDSDGGGGGAISIWYFAYEQNNEVLLWDFDVLFILLPSNCVAQLLSNVENSVYCCYLDIIILFQKNLLIYTRSVYVFVYFYFIASTRG